MNTATDALPSVSAPQNLHTRAELILLPGLGLGIAGDYLLRNGPLGPGLFTWLALLVAAALWLTRHAGRERRRILVLWSVTALAAAAITVLRALEGLIPAMLFVILGCAVLTALETRGIGLLAARVRDYFVTGFTFPLQMLTQTPRLLKQADLSALTHNRQMPDIMRGIVLAIPLLLVFGVLFAAADAGFSRYAGKLTHILSPDLPQHVLLVLVFGWAGTSLLGIACRRAIAAEEAPDPSVPAGLGRVEMHVVLGLVSALFVAFVVLQLGYLFGGSEFIVGAGRVTVAEYARRGFFELLVIVALTLGLLLLLGATGSDRGILRRYGTVLIACVFVILASALQRLFLYTDAFGMTLSRFNALTVMLWQAFNLVSFGFTVLRGNVRGFASALAISAIASLLLLGLVNPAAVVARINLDRAIEDAKPLDDFYLSQLGADAVPPILEKLDALPAMQQCRIAFDLLNAYPPARDGSPAILRNDDWRRWNASQAAAARAVAERADALSSMAALPLDALPFLRGPGAC